MPDPPAAPPDAAPPDAGVPGRAPHARRGVWRRPGLAWTLAIALLAALLHLIMAAQTGLGDSEAYYTAWSLAPQPSYLDHPPLIAWMLWLTTGLLGLSPLGVRLGPVLVVSAVAVALHALARRCGASPRAAFSTAALVLATPVFGIGGITASPDIPLALTWTAALLVAHRLLRSPRPAPWLWLAGGALLGLAFLAKYTGILLAPAALIAARRLGRPALRAPSFWAGAALALALAAPVLAWNIAHGFPSLQYHLIDRHDGAWPFHPKNAAALLGGQLGYLSPVIAALLAWTWWRLRGRLRAGAASDDERLLASFTSPVLLPLYLLCLATDEAEPHWPIMGYLPLYVLAGVYLEQATARVRRRWLAWSLGVALVLQALFFTHALTPTFVRLMPASYEPKYDIVNELYGWDEALTTFDARLPPPLRGATRYAGAHYVMCGQLAAHAGALSRVACPSPKQDAFDFLLIPPRPGEWLLFVSDNRYTTPVTALVDCAEHAPLGPEVIITRGGRLARRFQATLCRVASAFPPHEQNL